MLVAYPAHILDEGVEPVFQESPFSGGFVRFAEFLFDQGSQARDDVCFGNARKQKGVTAVGVPLELELFLESRDQGHHIADLGADYFHVHGRAPSVAECFGGAEFPTMRVSQGESHTVRANHGPFYQILIIKDILSCSNSCWPPRLSGKSCGFRAPCRGTSAGRCRQWNVPLGTLGSGLASS